MKRYQPTPKTSRQIGLYVLLLVGALAAMWMLRRCSHEPVSATREHELSGGDTINVAIEYSPMSVYVYDDTLGGFNYDLMRLVADKAGLVLKFHPLVSLDEALDGLDAGRFDVVAGDIPMTLGLQERYSFTEPVYLDKQVLVQCRDSAGVLMVSSQLDLAGKQVWVVASSPAASRLRHLSAEIGDTIYVNEHSDYGAEQLFLLTAVGEIQLAVINEKTARSMSVDYPDIDVSTAVSFTQFQAWSMRKDEDVLRHRLDSVITEFKSTSLYEDLCRKYFP